MADTFTPDRILRVVDEHDAVMRDARDVMGLVDAIYDTEFWSWWIGYGARSKQFDWKRNGSEVEVNRIWKEVSVYTAALYQRANRLSCSPDPLDRGDPRIGTLVLNAWASRQGTQQRVHSAVAMVIMLGWCGFKVGYDPGTANPIERAWVRVVPPWEMVLDRNVTDLADERYRGHVYQAPKGEIEARYPKLRGLLKGQRRTEFLDEAAASTTAPVKAPEGAPSDDEYVRIVEFYNLKDSVIGRSGDAYSGRLEVYVLDHGPLSRKPVVMLPLPFTDADGRNLPNIEPLIFAHRNGYPLRPIAPIKRLLPQAIERNLYRAKAADMTRRDARKVLKREGALGPDASTKLTSSVDMETIDVKDTTTELSKVVHVLPHAPISPAFLDYMRNIDADHQVVAGTSPNARGQITGATAYEVQQVQLFTESDLGFHGLLLYACLARVARLAQRAIIGAMKDEGDSEGGDDTGPLAPVGTIEEPAVEIGPDEAAEAEAPEKAPAPTPRLRPRLAMKSFPMKDREEKIEVTIPAIDADFEINFTEGARTPLTDQAMLEFLTGPGIDRYFKLFEVALGDGPDAVLAQRTMAHLADRANLPKDMRFEELKAQHDRMVKEKAPPPKSAPPPVVAKMVAAPQPEVSTEPPPPQGARVLLGVLQTAFSALQAAAQAAPDARALLAPAGRAVLQALRATEAGDVDTVQALVAEALRALEAVPPEVDVGAARSALGTIAEAIGASSGPATEAPQPGV